MPGISHATHARSSGPCGDEVMGIEENCRDGLRHDVVLFLMGGIMSMDTSTRPEKTQKSFARLGLIVGALIYAVLLCLSYL